LTLSVGIIGTGIMGADHALTLHRWVSGATVTGLVDLDRTRAEHVGEMIPSARVYDDPAALIEDRSVDAVVIASHDASHAELAAACVRAGKPVMCEKPLAPTLSEAVALLQELTTSEASLISLGFMRRFDPGYTALKKTITDRALGVPVLLHSVGRGVSSISGTTTESAITNSTIHDFDIVSWLLTSPVVEVSWHATRRSTEVDGFHDPQLILLRTQDGVLSTVETFLNARYGYDIRCDVVAELGTASLAEPVRTVTDTDQRRSVGYAADWRPRFADAYRLELQTWVDTVTAQPWSGSPSPLATAVDGLIASAVADAVIASMHNGGELTRVRVPLDQ
jgi:myo-inositol 2-dehydrogenase/D-chiro-inositol 1-dehydrogenase